MRWDYESLTALFTGYLSTEKTRAMHTASGYNEATMKLPELKEPEKYVGLYIVDFGDHSGVGFTPQEVAELLESEKYQHCKVYKIHRASPDGNLEIKGVQAHTFQLEAGMFFYADDIDTADADFKRLTNLAVTDAPPCRAKVHLAKYNDEKFVTAIIYPAEYDDEISSWLTEGQYRTSGEAQGGINAVQRYYESPVEILDRHQLFACSGVESRTGEELLAGVKVALQR